MLMLHTHVQSKSATGFSWYLPTQLPTLSIPIWSMSTKWELTKWELIEYTTQADITLVLARRALPTNCKYIQAKNDM